MAASKFIGQKVKIEFFGIIVEGVITRCYFIDGAVTDFEVEFKIGSIEQSVTFSWKQISKLNPLL